MSLTTCSGYKLARHAEIAFDNDGSFCPACEVIEEKQALQDELTEARDQIKLFEEKQALQDEGLRRISVV